MLGCEHLDTVRTSSTPCFPCRPLGASYARVHESTPRKRHDFPPRTSPDKQLLSCGEGKSHGSAFQIFRPHRYPWRYLKKHCIRLATRDGYSKRTCLPLSTGNFRKTSSSVTLCGRFSFRSPQGKNSASEMCMSWRGLTNCGAMSNTQQSAMSDDTYMK